MIEFIKGRSITFTLVFNAEYDPDNIEDIIVKINSDIIGQLSEDTVITTANERVFRVELSSEYTAGMREVSYFQVFLDDSVLGVRPFEQQMVRAYSQLEYSNSSINLGSDFTLLLTVAEGSQQIEFETITIYNTLSGALLINNNLSDLENSSEARDNLGLGSLSTQSGNFSDKVTLQVSSTFASIGSSIEKRFIEVVADETNGNDSTLYFHNGTNLNWVVTLQV
jgi:hypothetical protein